jgi:hypothetical protein
MINTEGFTKQSAVAPTFRFVPSQAILCMSPDRPVTSSPRLRRGVKRAMV